MSPAISVIGLDGGPLREEAELLLREAALVAGGERHLQEMAIEPGRAVALKGDLSEALSAIEAADGPVAVLASGDPGFFGIVRTLGERFGGDNLRVVPGVSSVALVAARAGLPWEDAVTVSAHGRDPRRAVNVCRAFPKTAVFTAPGFGPAELAGELDRPAWRRTMFVAERLGGPEERTFRGSPAEVSERSWRDPNVVLCVDEGQVGHKRWISGPERAGGWALPRDEFEHRSAMITGPEPRALVLARLAPRPGDLVWDIGAGSGSVAVECARLGAAAVAIEREAESCERIRRNAARHGAYVEVAEGEAPEALGELPDPDAVFVGGTGGGFEEILKLAAVRARRAVVLTLISLERVVPAGELLEGCGLAVETTLLQASHLRGVGPLHRLASETPVFVVSGHREDGP